MLKGVFKPLLCSVFLVGQMIHAQEVVVPHETKPEAPEQAALSSESEQTPSESAAPVRTKPRPREKKSVAPTLEQMRASGALAGEGVGRGLEVGGVEAVGRGRGILQGAHQGGLPAREGVAVIVLRRGGHGLGGMRRRSRRVRG